MLGVGLASAAGFRVFVPPLLLAASHQLGWVDLPGDAGWLESRQALLLLAAATVAEVFAYYIPLVDNLLDALAAPAALVAGTVLAGTVFPDTEPWLRWTAAAILGGGAAGGVQALTTLGRATSTGTTGGLANPLIATAELGGAVGMTVLSLAAPFLAAAVVIVLVIVVVRLLLRRRGSRCSSSTNDSAG